MRRVLPLLLLLASLPQASQAAGHHVRVVLDTSLSMELKNDKDRLAILATLLLHDLARPNDTKDDSFEVLPFVRDWAWQPRGEPPDPASLRPIAAHFSKREAFAKALQALEYDGKKTYFYPGLRAAVDQLVEKGGRYDTRTIVLITDGLPEPDVRELDRERVLGDIVPDLEEHGILLYVLAFGSDLSGGDAQSFLHALDGALRARASGQVLHDPEGSRLLHHMLEIFSQRFGYVVSQEFDLPGRHSVDLHKGLRPDKVAIVALARGSAPPSLRVEEPAEGVLNIGDQPTAAERGASYALAWVLKVEQGTYSIGARGPPGRLAVLRPVGVRIEVVASERAGASPSIHASMARQPFRVAVQVRSEQGASPGNVQLRYWAHGPWRGEDFAWRGDEQGPMDMRDTGDARIFEIEVRFDDNRTDPGAPHYDGYLEIEVKRGDAAVGARLQDRAFPVRVYRYLALRAFPQDGNLGLMRGGATDCRTFAVKPAPGTRLPEPDEGPDRWRMTARAIVDADTFRNELHLASMRLQGRAVPFEGQGAPADRSWLEGQRLSRAQLLGEEPLEVCLTLGEPLRGDPTLEIPLSLRLRFMQAPYHHYDLIQPYRLDLAVEAGTNFLPAATLLLVGLLVLGLLWYLRDRPAVPPDLRYAIGLDESSMQSQELLPGSALARFLGRVSESPVVAETGGEPLGWVVPIDAGLYRLRLGPGVRLARASSAGEESALDSGRLAVHTLYRLRTDQRQYVFRMEYRPEPS